MGERLATIDMGRQLGGCVPLGGAGCPPNTMSPGPRPTAVPSFVLIHPSVWPQYTNVTDRQTGKTNKAMVRQHRANRFTNGSPKIKPVSGTVRGIRTKFGKQMHNAIQHVGLYQPLRAIPLLVTFNMAAPPFSVSSKAIFPVSDSKSKFCMRIKMAIHNDPK